MQSHSIHVRLTFKSGSIFEALALDFRTTTEDSQALSMILVEWLYRLRLRTLALGPVTDLSTLMLFFFVALFEMQRSKNTLEGARTHNGKVYTIFSV